MSTVTSSLTPDPLNDNEYDPENYKTHEAAIITWILTC